MRNVLFIIMIGLILTVSACSESYVESPSAPPEPTIEELEARVIENCNIFRDALEEFMDNNRHGACPVDIFNDTNDLGLTVIDLLPDGELLENPFTGERTEPVNTIATEPGQTGYYLRLIWAPFLYYINGIGETHTIVELSNLEELEQKVIENCFLVREAVMRFAMLNDGVYPTDVALDTTPEGYTVINLLPGGVALENPFTGCAEEPTDGAACTPGDTGYVPIVTGLSNVGYVITGCGNAAGVTIFTAALEPYCTSISIFDEFIYCSGDCCPE